ncbi:hypothetical protein Anapl_03670 [Anas platyrhynchos]|uniref:Uncharacterized protein n=1 Tax=Anas platyrhynchos TaxID=8839 RepID=R0K9I4_ANAPL|nr:hypothetical protein Anapl_03670 [Anas platyrhynchos]
MVTTTAADHCAQVNTLWFLSQGESRAHTHMVQAGMSPQAEAQPKAKAMWCAAMYLATYMQPLCLGQKSLREGLSMGFTPMWHNLAASHRPQPRPKIYAGTACEPNTFPELAAFEFPWGLHIRSCFQLQGLQTATGPISETQMTETYRGGLLMPLPIDLLSTHPTTCLQLLIFFPSASKTQQLNQVCFDERSYRVLQVHITANGEKVIKNGSDYKFSKDEGETRASIYNSCEKSAQVLLYRSPEVPSLGDLLDMLPSEQSTLHLTADGAEQDFPALDILQQVKDAAAKIASIPSACPCSGASPRWRRRRSAAAMEELGGGLVTREEQEAEVEQAKLQGGEMKTFSEDEKEYSRTAEPLYCIRLVTCVVGAFRGHECQVPWWYVTQIEKLMLWTDTRSEQVSEGLSQNKPRIAITTAKGDMQGDICSAVLKEVGVTVCMGMMIIKVLNQKVWNMTMKEKARLPWQIQTGGKASPIRNVTSMHWAIESKGQPGKEQICAQVDPYVGCMLYQCSPSLPATQSQKHWMHGPERWHSVVEEGTTTTQSLPVPPGLSYSYCQQTEHPLKLAGFSNTVKLFIQTDTNMSTFSLLEAVYRKFSSLGTSSMADIFIPVELKMKRLLLEEDIWQHRRELLEDGLPGSKKKYQQGDQATSLLSLTHSYAGRTQDFTLIPAGKEGEQSSSDQCQHCQATVTGMGLWIPISPPHQVMEQARHTAQLMPWGVHTFARRSWRRGSISSPLQLKVAKETRAEALQKRHKETATAAMAAEGETLLQS